MVKGIGMKKILFATGNVAKVNRFKDKLLKNNIELLSLKDLDINLEVEENGKDAIENALIKARAYYGETDIPVMAMDDSLYIDNVPEDVDILVYGHFHIGFIKEKKSVIFVNPGSISLPKNDTPNSYLIIEDRKLTLKDIEMNVIEEFYL